MYNPLLTAFVCAADCGSFTKAAEKLYLSPTAVMKQINTLESHLQLQLISRTNQGHPTHTGRGIQLCRRKVSVRLFRPCRAPCQTADVGL